MTVRRALAALILAAGLLLMLGTQSAAEAHSETAAADWWAEWQAQVDTQGLTPELMSVAVDFYQRHLPPEPRPTSAGASTSGTYSGMGGNVEQWRGLVGSYGGWNVNLMLCIMRGESGGNPNAQNPTSSAAGLFQIMGFWWDKYGGDRYDPATNVRVAHLIWQQQGYSAWAVYNKGHCG